MPVIGQLLLIIDDGEPGVKPSQIKLREYGAYGGKQPS